MKLNKSDKQLARPVGADRPSPPVHVAIIMDGNGRWAKARMLPRTEGHRQGIEAARRTIQAAADLGIGYITLYGFSSENWKRPTAEVNYLMGLLRYYLRNETAQLHQDGVRVRIIGDREKLDPDLVALIDKVEGDTGGNTRLQLIVALSYGSRSEIAAAARRIAEQVRAGVLAPEAISEDVFADHLATAGIPDPDLVVRTSGEQRLSNFLLWQSAYAELVFTDVLWPDFTKADLEEAVREFHRRERRYGAAAG
jgi:undecaprenyl diphosphate synthase